MSRALGRYELLRPLARGGMAEVYLARRRAAGIEKWLVVKRMRPERAGDPRFLDLFVREARLSMSLVHQNIVPVFDFGRIDDQVFLAMERVEGKDLGSSLARAADHRLPPLLAAFIAAECCQALDYAHQRKAPDGVALGIVHRDVTPRNVLLSWSGEVKLTDFGIAALAGDATEQLLGTPQYMAPEQARSEPIDPRADIYAVGLVLREAVTGVRPRPGADRDAILEAARRGELVPWPPPADPALALGSGDHGEPPPAAAAPPALIAIIERATAYAAADRYPDARSMLEDLDAFIVAERAARKAESPARQLAAWLAGVWEGERADADADAAIEADHLVSFLDDGAMDVLGTGTVRSMADTAADELSGEPTPGEPAPGEPTPGELPPTAESDADLPAIARVAIAGGPAARSSTLPPAGARPDAAPRSPRISSSISAVASGSFHTIPAPDEANRMLPRRAVSRRAAPIAAIALIAIASSAVVLWLRSELRNRDAKPTGPVAMEQPGTERPETGQPGAGRDSRPTTGGRSGAGESSGGQPATGQSGSGQPASGQHDTGQPSAGQHSVGQSHVGPPTTRQPGTGQPSVGQHSAGQSHVGPPTTGQPGTGQPHRPSTSGQPSTGQDGKPPDAVHVGSGHAEHPEPAPPGGTTSSGSTAAVGSAPSPATCKVRFNITPWAYFTVDDDSTRHETPGTIDLPPGPHRLHVWNPELHIERDIVLSVPADRDTMSYSEPLQPTSIPSAPR